MVELWFALLSATLIVFAVLDGWNFGAGILHLFVARTSAERRQVIDALGPIWSWHEVWLIAAGGTFLMAFPSVMAAAFSGFYLALWMVVWSLLLRGVSVEVGGHLHDPLWQSAWDVVFAISSLLLALLFGAALGNVIRGLPIGADGRFSMALFTDFGVHGTVGILDWYTLSVASFTAALIAAHGGLYLACRSTGAVHARTIRGARWLWAGVAALFPLVSWQTAAVRPQLHQAVAGRPLAWLAVLTAAGAAWTIAMGVHRQQWHRAFIGSCVLIAALLAGLAASSFPAMLVTTIAGGRTFTAYDGAAAAHGLLVASIWWPIAFVLAVTYAVLVVRAHARGPAV